MNKGPVMTAGDEKEIKADLILVASRIYQCILWFIYPL